MQVPKPRISTYVSNPFLYQYLSDRGIQNATDEALDVYHLPISLIKGKENRSEILIAGINSITRLIARAETIGVLLAEEGIELPESVASLIGRDAKSINTQPQPRNNESIAKALQINSRESSAAVASKDGQDPGGIFIDLGGADEPEQIDSDWT